MDKVKQWVALTAVGCLALLAAGWFLLVSPKRSDASDLRQQASEQQSQNAQAQVKLAMLKAQAKGLPKKQAELADVASKIPNNPSLPSLIRALDQASTESGVELVSLAPGTPAAVSAAGASSATPAAPVTPAPAAGSAPAGSVSAAATPVASSLGTLAAIPVAINVVGGYFEVQQFLSSIEELPRSLRVTNLTLAPGTNPVSTTKPSGTAATDGRSLTATITGQVYMTTSAATQPSSAPTVPAAK